MNNIFVKLLLLLFFLAAFLNNLTHAEDHVASSQSDLIAQVLDLQAQGKTQEALVLCQNTLRKSFDRDRRIAAWNGLGLLCLKEKDWPRARYLFARMIEEIRLKEIETASGAFVQVYSVARGDSFSKIAKHFHMTAELLKRMNPRAKQTLVAGEKVRVLKEPFQIAVDQSDRLLELWLGDERIKTYCVATGKGDLTPEGEFSIATKVKDPDWYVKGRVIAANSPENLLGTRWLGLNKKGFGIHGTTLPRSIGLAASHGCVRMMNRDVEELYDLVPIGTRVRIRG